MNWNLAGTLIAAMATMLGIPLTAMVLYLKSIRSDQRVIHGSLARRVDDLEDEYRRIRDAVDRIEVAYTPREEWLRETMLARRQLERLTEMMARLQAEGESSRALATQFHRATNAIIELTERLVERLAASRDERGVHQ